MNVTRGIKSLEGLRGEVQQCVSAQPIPSRRPLEDSVRLSHYQLEAPGITGLRKAARSSAENPGAKDRLSGSTFRDPRLKIQNLASSESEKRQSEVKGRC